MFKLFLALHWLGGGAFPGVRPALAAKVVEDVFLAVWRSAGRFGVERMSVSTWILRFVRRRAVDVARGERLVRAEPLEAPFPPAISDGTAHEAWSRLQRGRVRAALRSVPEPERELIGLAYYEGLSLAEVAQRLEEPMGIVASRLFAGLTRLGELIREPELAGERERTPSAPV